MSGPLPGDFLVTPTHADHIEALGGWLIRWGTDAPVNHAALYVGDGHLIEAAPSGVRRVKMRAGGYPDAFWSTGRFDLSPSERGAICGAAQVFVDARPKIGFGGVHLFADGRIPGLVSPGDLWRLIGSPTMEVDHG
jgi:hypothetical protein